MPLTMTSKNHTSCWPKSTILMLTPKDMLSSHKFNKPTMYYQIKSSGNTTTAIVSLGLHSRRIKNKRHISRLITVTRSSMKTWKRKALKILMSRLIKSIRIPNKEKRKRNNLLKRNRPTKEYKIKSILSENYCLLVIQFGKAPMPTWVISRDKKGQARKIKRWIRCFQKAEKSFTK